MKTLAPSSLQELPGGGGGGLDCGRKVLTALVLCFGLH